MNSQALEQMASSNPSSSFTVDDDFSIFSQTSQTSQATVSLGHSREPQTRSFDFKGLKLIGTADPCPSNLEQIKFGQFVLWTQETADSFEAWFSTTPFARAVQSEKTTPQKWFLPTWNTTRRRAKDAAWSHFHEAVEVPQGIPRLICKYCKIVVNHPDLRRDGTTNMTRHLSSASCSRNGKRPLEAQEKIDGHFKKVHMQVDLLL